MNDMYADAVQNVVLRASSAPTSFRCKLCSVKKKTINSKRCRLVIDLPMIREYSLYKKLYCDFIINAIMIGCTF